MEDRRDPRASRETEGSRGELERAHQRESLQSSRRGVVRELEATTSDLRRRSLKAALKHLDDQLAKMV